MPDRKTENLKKMSLLELKEVLNREISLLRNRKLIQKLPDKGDSIREFHKLVENEIKYREELDDLKNSMKTLSVLDNTEKHIKKLCEFEKNPEKDRYKPFATLNRTIEIKPDRKVFKLIEDCKLDNNPTKLIPLFESINILKEQEERIKEEQIKIRYQRLMDKLKESNDEKSVSDEDNSVASSLSDEEN